MEILPQLLLNALIAGSIYALASAGLSLTYGLLRILNFAHGHIMMVGVYVFYFFSVQLLDNSTLGLVGSLVLTVLATIGLALVSMRVFVTPFVKYSFLLPLVSTIALSTILESLVSMFFGVEVKALSAGAAGNSFEIWDVYITSIQIVIITSSIVLLFGLSFIIHSTSLGRKIRALSEKTESAESLGISQAGTCTAVYTVACLLTVYAGILIGYETNLQPTMGGVYTIKAFAAMVLGGLGNIWGTVLGAYFLGLLENLSIGLDFGSYSLPAGYRDAFAFFIILLVLLFKPEGIFSKRRRVI